MCWPPWRRWNVNSSGSAPTPASLRPGPGLGRAAGPPSLAPSRLLTRAGCWRTGRSPSRMWQPASGSIGRRSTGRWGLGPPAAPDISPSECTYPGRTVAIGGHRAVAQRYKERKRLTFAQAEGAEPLPSQLALKEISPELRARLWAVVYNSLEKSKEVSRVEGRSYVTGH